MLEIDCEKYQEILECREHRRDGTTKAEKGERSLVSYRSFVFYNHISL